MIEMARTKTVAGGFHGLFRMKVRGKWHTVARTDGQPIVFESQDDALASAENTGHRYRTGQP